MDKIEVVVLSFGGAYAAGKVTVRYPSPRESQTPDATLYPYWQGDNVYFEEDFFVLRWDANGDAVLLHHGDAKPTAISDDGKTIPLNVWGSNMPLLWKEGEGTKKLQEYLKAHGVTLPGTGYRNAIWQVCMSPDGRCFSGQLPTNDTPSPSFLACVDCDALAIVPPHWDLPEEIL